jgi:hypothetical protein
MSDMPPTPALDKQHASIEEGHSQEIGQFIEWLHGQGVHFMRWVPDDEAADNDYVGYWALDHRSLARLLADYFEVDLAAVEAERRAILDAIRAQQR